MGVCENCKVLSDVYTGKSVLCSSIIEAVASKKESTAIYHIFTYRASAADQSVSMFRSLASQLIRQHKHLAQLVHDDYISNGWSACMQNLKRLLPQLLSVLDNVRIIVDGLDELENREHKPVLQELISLTTTSNLGNCKLLLSSREVQTITRLLSKRPTLRLSEERKFIAQAIHAYVHHIFSDLQDRFHELFVAEETLNEIEDKIVERSEGMFLYARLVLVSLETVYSLNELREVIDALPPGLDEVYNRILQRIHLLGPPQWRKAMHVFEWISFAACDRPLRVHELQDGVAFSLGASEINEETKMSPELLSLCKPLIEEDIDGSVTFVHLSVREFLLHRSSGPAINFPTGNLNIALACISEMRVSLHFAPELGSTGWSLYTIGAGFHGLYRYANEYWWHHVLEYCSTVKEAEISDILVEKLLPFCEACQSLDPSLKVDAVDTQMENKLQRFGQHHPIRMVLGFVLRKISRKDNPEEEKKDEGYQTSTRDLDLFSKLNTLFDTMLHSLLNASHIAGLTIHQLRRFKEVYGPSAWVCRFSHCSRKTAGFANEFARNEHERLHKPRLYCNDPSCFWANVGFKSTQSLQKHLRRDHKVISDVKIVSAALSRLNQDDPYEVDFPMDNDGPLLDNFDFDSFLQTDSADGSFDLRHARNHFDS